LLNIQFSKFQFSRPSVKSDISLAFPSNINYYVTQVVIFGGFFMAKGDNQEDTEKPKQEAKSSGGGGLVKILVVVVLIVVLAVAGILAYTLLFAGKSAPAQEQTIMEPTGGQPSQATRPASAEPGPIIAYPPFLVNLADPGGQRYLRITLSLELSKEKKFQAEVEAKDPRIKDIIISILSSKTFDEIATTQGKIAMKQEILRRLNTIMSGGRIVDVYITEFVVQ
jgi:flagellar FliL protein